MRGGPLAERRVIDLLNRRFVSFYYNTFKGGVGYDAKAAAFIAKHDKRFSGLNVPTPPVWIFSPSGELLTTIDNYTGKDEFFAALMKVLKDHPKFDADTEMESSVFGKALAHPNELEFQLLPAIYAEELGRYDRAKLFYEACTLLEPKSPAAVYAKIGLARLKRYAKDWKGADALLADAEAINKGKKTKLADDIQMERAHALLAAKHYTKARKLLNSTIKAYPNSDRLGELHFYAGVSCFMLGERDWANFHWCWVLENIPYDRHYMRCLLAATADSIPYPNPELDGYRGKNSVITTAATDAARALAVKDYERLKGKY